ncbi:MAG: SAM-dependent methyltransferase [Chitinophagales bacterium]
MPGKLILIPSSLGEASNFTIPEYVKEYLMPLRYFAVEREKTARRFLRSLGFTANFDEVELFDIGKRSEKEDVLQCLEPLLSGHDMGVISEAGMPCVADPGQFLVQIAQENKITVKPLVGPNALLLALAASGLNGQSFAFHGYLPIPKKERQNAIRDLERNVFRNGQTQMFMETPYRNHALIEDVVNTCNPNTLFCVACDLTLSGETVKTMPVSEWKKTKLNYHKRPAVFLLGKAY